MTDGIETRVTALERRMDVMDVHHQENVRRLVTIEGLSAGNNAKLDTLLLRTAKEDGADEAEKRLKAAGEKAANRTLNLRVAIAAIVFALMGCLIEAHWQILP